MIFKYDEFENRTRLSDIIPGGRRRAQQRGDEYSDIASKIDSYLQQIDSLNQHTASNEVITSKLKQTQREFVSSLESSSNKAAKHAIAIKDNAVQLRAYSSALKQTGEQAQISSEKVSLFANTSKKLASIGNALTSTVGGMLISMAASALIDTILSALDHAVNSRRYIAEAAEAARQEIEEIRDSYKSLHDSVLGSTRDSIGLAHEYAKLVSGVDNFGGNVSLSTEEYERFLDISNQLAYSFPALTKHYDENGNALLNLRGSYEDILSVFKELIEAENSVSNQKILDASPKLIAESQSQIVSARERLLNREIKYVTSPSEISGNNLFEILDNLISAEEEELEGTTVSIPFEIDPQINATMAGKDIRAVFREIGVDVISSGLDGHTLSFTISESDLATIQNNSEKFAGILDPAALREYQRIVDSQYAQMAPTITAMLQENFDFSMLSPALQNAIEQSTRGINWAKITTFEELESALQNEYVKPFAELAQSPELSKALEELYNFSSRTDIDLSDFERDTNLLTDILTESYKNAGKEMPSVVSDFINETTKSHFEVLNALQSRFSELGIDLESVFARGINTAAEADMFLNVTRAATDAASAIDAYNTALYNQDVSVAVTESEALITTLMEHQTLLSEVFAFEELTIEQYEALVSYSEEYRAAIELEGQQLTVNREKVLELAEAKQSEAKASVADGKVRARYAYGKNTKELSSLIGQYQKLRATGEDTSDALSRILELQGTQTSLYDTIMQYEMMESALSNVSQAYKQYEAMLGASSPEDHYETNLTAVDSIKSGLESGKVGTSEFMASVELMIPDSVYRDIDDKVGAVGEYYDETLSRYFRATGDNKDDYSKGITNFLNDAETAGLMEKTYDDDGLETWTVASGKKLKDFAKELNLTEAAAESMFKIMNAYSFGGNAFDFADEFLASDDLSTQALGIDLKMQKLLEDKSALLADTTVGLDDSRIKAIDEELAILEQKKHNLEIETVVNVSTRANYESELRALEEELEKTRSGEIDVNISGRSTEQIQTEINAILRKIQESGGALLPAEIEFATENIDSAIIDAKAELAAHEEAFTVNGTLQYTVEGADEAERLQNNINILEGSREILVALNVSGNANSEIAAATEETNALTIAVNACNQVGEIKIVGFDQIKAGADIATAAISGTTAALNSIPKEVSSHVSVHTSYTSSGDGPKVNGTASASGTAHAHGSAKASGDWGLKRNETALTGELGRELVVRGSRWFTVGDNGAGFANLRKGDIVFNAQQTEDILKHGGTRGRGRALLSGTFPSDGLALVTGSFSFRKYKTSSSSGSSSSSVNSDYNYNSGNDYRSDKDDFKETVDWIEKELDRLQRKIDQTAIVAESAYETFSSRNKALASEYNQIAKKIEENTKGIARYEAEANAVGLSSHYAKLVQDGAIDIETITDEDLKEKIDLYAQWYSIMLLYSVTSGGILSNC